MSWGRVDDRLDDNRKFVGLDLAAVGLWTMCLPQALRRGDGFVPQGVPLRFAQGRGSHAPSRLIGLLVERGLWDVVDGGWFYHDFHSYSKLSAVRSVAGSKGAEVRWQTHSKRIAKDASRVGYPEPVVTSTDVLVTPEPEPVKESLVTQVTPEVQSLTQEIFDFWRHERGKNGHTRLDSKRVKVIRDRYKDGYMDGDMREAIMGIALDPWPERSRFDDLTIIFKDASHLERFRGFFRNPPRPVLTRQEQRAKADRDLFAKAGFTQGERHD